MTTEEPTSAVPQTPEPDSQEPAEQEAAPQEPAPVVGQHRAVENLADLSEAEAQDIASHSVPAHVRRAPKMGPFFTIGALLGIGLGLLIGMWLSEPDMEKRGVYVAVTVVFITTIVELIMGAVVVYLDKRSAKGLDQ